MMKIIIEQGALLKALGHVQSIVQIRQNADERILANVLLEASGEGVSLRAINPELEIVEKIPAKVEEEGSITVSAHGLHDVVRHLPAGAEISIAFLSETSQVNVVSGRAKFILASLAPETFPTMARLETPVAFDVPAEQLLSLFNQTSFAASVEESRYALNGVYLHEKEGRLVAVATDGHRFACAQIVLPSGAEGMPSVILPSKTISEMSKLLAENVENVHVSLSANQIRFKMKEIELSSRLVDGTYLDYEKLVPAQNDKILEVDAKALMDAVERVSVVSEKTKGINLSLQQNLLKVSSAVTDQGAAEDELDAVYTSEDLMIGVNYRYLLDILRQIKGQNVKISLQDCTTAIILQDATDNSALYVLMPMRV